MSIIDDRAKDFVSGLGRFAYAAPKFAWDIITAGWNDEKEYNGFRNTLKTATTDYLKNQLHVVGSAFTSLMIANEELIRKPSTSLMLLNEQVNPLESNDGSIKNALDLDTWRKAWTQRHDISWGQAYGASKTSQALTPFLQPFLEGPAQIANRYDETPSSIKPQDKNFDVFNSTQRDAVFKNSLYGRVFSGGADAFAQIFGDVSLIGAKGAAAVKAGEKFTDVLSTSDDFTRAIKEVTDGVTNPNSKYYNLLNDFAQNDETFALTKTLVKDSDQPGLLSSALGRANTREEAAQVLKSAFGDKDSLAILKQKRASIGDDIERALGVLTEGQKNLAMGSVDELGTPSMFGWQNPKVMAEAKRVYDDLLANDEQLKTLIDMADIPGGVLRRGAAGKNLAKVEGFVEDLRAARQYDTKASNPNIAFFQNNPFGRAIVKASWAIGERPAGRVDLNDPDSYREISATLDRAFKNSLKDKNMIPAFVKGVSEGNFDNVKHLLSDEDLAKFTTKIENARLTNDAETIKNVTYQVQKIVESKVLVTEETIRNLSNLYLKTTTPEARSQALLTLETTIYNSILAKHNIPVDKAEEILSAHRAGRQSLVESMKNNGFAAEADALTIIKDPLLESQTANWLPIMDFDHLNRVIEAQGDVLRSVQLNAYQTLETVNDLFKAGALLRLGYPIRNGVDTQLRIGATVGTMAALRHLPKGMGNFIYNRRLNFERLGDKLLMGTGIEGKLLADKSMKELSDDLATEAKKLADAERRLKLDPNDVDAMGMKAVAQQMIDEKKPIFDLVSQKKRRVGEGQIKITTSDGSTYIVDDMFAGPLGDMYRKLSSADNSLLSLTDSMNSILNAQYTSKGIGILNPKNVKNLENYFQEWSNVLNQQFRNSMVMRKFANGETVENITNWLIKSPEGRDLRKRLNIESTDAYDHVSSVTHLLDRYLPSKELQARLFNQGIKQAETVLAPSDLRLAFPDNNQLPVIHGHVISDNLENITGKLHQRFIQSAFKLLGSLPEDVLGGHPLAMDLYRKDMTRRINLMTEADRLNPEQIFKAEMAARRIATNGLKKILYRMDRKSNLGYLMRLVSPFFSAQENAYKTWFRIGTQKAYIFNRANLLWNAPNRAGLVTDNDGNPIDPDKMTYDGTIWLEVPKPLQKIPGLKSLNNIGIPKRSLDVVFGGNFNLSVGPYVAIPVSEVLKRKPEYQDVLNWALPFGTDDSFMSLGQLVPTWAKRLITRQMEESSPEYARGYQLIWLTEQYKARKEGRDPVAPEVISKMTKDYYSMRTVANLILPFSPKFNSPYRYYIDKWQEFQRLYGKDAEQKFLDQFGEEFFAFSTSLSETKSKAQASTDAYRNILDNKGLVGEVYNIEPALVGLLVNNPTGYEFSSAIYDWQYTEKVAPGSSETFRNNIDPAEAQRRNEAKLGWIKYRKLMNYVDAELEQRGLTSVNKAPDLANLKNLVVSKLATDNTAWYDDYLDTDGSKTNRVIRGLSTILSDEDFINKNKNNPTWQAVKTYLNYRQQFAEMLASRNKGTIDNQANKDIRFLYDTMIAKLKKDDIGFSDMYDRFLSQDKVYDKYLAGANQ